ncbi:MAG: AAA domain-containing protein, partial [Vicinamibacteria bacterium]
SPIDRYSFPAQALDAREGDELHTSDGESLGTVEAVDRAARWVDVKKRLDRVEDHPRWAFIHSNVPNTALAASLMRLGRDVVARGLADPALRSASRELLLGNVPRVKKGVLGPRTGETSLDFAKRTVLDLDCSILPIQGPPGAGKTYTGARMIGECVRRGLKVGITAVGHKVIRNLLDAVFEAAKEEKIALSCVQKVRERGPELPKLEQVTNNEGVLDALTGGRAKVGAGTAWLWSREEYAGAVDVLFVDEAGQASLANVLAMSQAARSVVLLGDPQQLEQPQRGTHPEGVDASALEHLLVGHKTIPDDRGIFLDKTWRLAPGICAFTSELFYEGRLESRPKLARQKLSGAPPYEGAGLWFVAVEHDGNTNSSPEEVKAVEVVVSKLLRKGSSWTNTKGKTKQMTADDILVVAPFNAQVNLLQDALESRQIQVGTVDR